MKVLHKNGGAYMLQIGILQIIGYALIMVASASVYLHNAALLQDTFMGGLWGWSWLLVAFGAGLLVAKWLMDPKVVVLIMAIAALIWGLVVMK